MQDMRGERFVIGLDEGVMFQCEVLSDGDEAVAVCAIAHDERMMGVANKTGEHGFQSKSATALHQGGGIVGVVFGVILQSQNGELGAALFNDGGKGGVS